MGTAWSQRMIARTRRKRREHPPESWRWQLAQRIEDCRRSSGLTLAGAAALSGCSRGLWSKIESGQRSPGAYTLMRMAHALKVSADYLLGLTHVNRRDYDGTPA